MRQKIHRYGGALLTAMLCALPAAAQVDQQRASKYFKEAAALCVREGGRIWGVSLCGPMAFADAATHTIATNQPAPAIKPPATIGLANTAIEWDGNRWSTFVWRITPHDNKSARARLMLHELFHRIQPQLGLLVGEGKYDHLDTLDGRYWIQLEWRALARALGAAGSARTAAMRDALAFRLARRKLFQGAGENEQRLEINEGLAQYTGTVSAFPSVEEATADAIDQLVRAEEGPTFVRTFAYPSGAAYGILLDDCSPGWTRRIKSSDDLGQLLMAAAHVAPAVDAEAAAKSYGGPELRAAETNRDAEQKARVTELRRRFVEGPVLALPRPRNATFTTAGMTPIPGEGTMTPGFRTEAEWGTLEAASVLVAPDRSKLAVPAPASVEGPVLRGEGWTLTIAPGWVVRPGARAGDYQLMKETDAPQKQRRGPTAQSVPPGHKAPAGPRPPDQGTPAGAHAVGAQVQPKSVERGGGEPECAAQVPPRVPGVLEQGIEHGVMIAALAPHTHAAVAMRGRRLRT